MVEHRNFSRGAGVRNQLLPLLNVGNCNCLCLSEEKLKAVGHSYLVSMPGEVKDPTQG